MDINELRALHAAATPGEWFVQNGHRHREQASAALHDGNGRIICDTLNAEDTMIFEEPDELSSYFVEENRVKDLDFCAAAHNNLIPILDRLEKAEQERDELAFELGKVNRAVTSPELYTAIHESLKPSRDKRDARMKALGAAEWLEAKKVSHDGWLQMTGGFIESEAARMRREAGE